MISSGVLSQKIGVSYANIQKFVSKGALPVRVTIGGRFRFREADVEAIRATFVKFGVLDDDAGVSKPVKGKSKAMAAK